jgi:hypothetical protein
MMALDLQLTGLAERRSLRNLGVAIGAVTLLFVVVFVLFLALGRNLGFAGDSIFVILDGHVQRVSAQIRAV